MSRDFDEDDLTDEFEDEFEDGERPDDVRTQATRVAEAFGELTKEVIKLQFSLATLPFRALPQDTRRHTRTAAAETFRAIRAMVDEAADRLEDALEGAERTIDQSEEIVIEDEDLVEDIEEKKETPPSQA